MGSGMIKCGGWTGQNERAGREDAEETVDSTNGNIWKAACLKKKKKDENKYTFIFIFLFIFHFWEDTLYTKYPIGS